MNNKDSISEKVGEENITANHTAGFLLNCFKNNINCFAGEEKTAGTPIRGSTRGHVHIASAFRRDALFCTLSCSHDHFRLSTFYNNKKSGPQETRGHSFERVLYVNRK